jgi:thiol-disulfide isomerase/thioredoxin
MKKLLITIAILLIASVASAASPFSTLSPLSKEDKGLIEAGEMSLIDVLMRDHDRTTFAEKNGDYIMFDFYTVWCGTCKDVKKIFEDLMPRFTGKIHLVGVDETRKRSDGVFLHKNLITKKYPGDDTGFIPYLLFYKLNKITGEYEQMSRGYPEPLYDLYYQGFQTEKLKEYLEINDASRSGVDSEYFHVMKKLSRYDKDKVKKGDWNLLDILMRDFDRMTFAEKHGEIIVFDFYTTWCHTCTKFKEMFHEILKNPPYKSYFVEIDQTNKKSTNYMLKEELVMKKYPDEETKFVPYFLIYQWNFETLKYELKHRGFEDALLGLWHYGYQSRDYKKMLQFLKLLPKD